MKIVSKLQQGAVLEQDNTKVYRAPRFESIKVEPKQYQLTDLGGEPSKDNRTSTERNKDYWHPIRGVKERFKSSMKNETNPLVGLERTIMPAMAGAALVTTPATVIGGIAGSVATNKLTGGWGNWLENKTGIPSELGEYLNPGGIYGGIKGYKIDSNKLASKFIKGDKDLGWTPLNKNHWLFNKEARTPTNIAMATANRVMPFLSNIGKTPARIAAYKVGKRTQGNASVSPTDIKSNESTYTGSATPEGNNGNRNLLGLYLFKNDPIISKSPWFKKISESFKPARGKGFEFGQRYNELYPGIENRRYQMQSAVPEGHPLKFKNINEFNEYSGNIGKVQGKEGDMVIDIGGRFKTFRQPGTNYVGPIDDVGGHVVKIDYNNKGKLTQTSQDMWKFNPFDYSKRWSGNNIAEAVRSTKQAALMDKVGTPFILQQENPIYIGARRIWNDIQNVPNIVKNRRQPLLQSGLLTFQKGGKFTFKKNRLVKNAQTLNGKRDMRKKFIKSDRPTYNRNKIHKGSDGLKFVGYQPTEDIKYNMSDTFEEYKYPVPTIYNETPIEQPTEIKKEEIKKEETVPINVPVNKELPASKLSNKDFISQMRPAFINALTKRGLDPKYADYLVAQSALESGWGKHQSGKFNFGGIKGKGTVKRTREVINGKDVYINDSFRDFNSLDDYADYHVGLLNNKRYNAFGGEDFVDRVIKGGYATDPKYKIKLNKMYQQIANV